MESSEDTFSWNVFRSLQEAGRLEDVAAMVTGELLPYEPDFYPWGLRLNDDSFEPWPLLVAARKRFES